MIRSFTPWMWGFILVQSTLLALYLGVLRHQDPVAWGFALVANAVVMAAANLGTEIVHAIRERKP